MGNTIIACFSAHGHTARLAETFSKVLNCGIYDIEPQKPYSAAELDWKDPGSRSSLEMKDKNSRPALKEVPSPFEETTVVLMFPIWWYEAPRIIQTFLESCDMSGKTIVPVCTSGGSDLGNTGEILKRSCPESTKWLPGRRFSPSAKADEIKKWAEGLGII